MTKVGDAEGIDHGTPRGARQHARRHVKICGPCEEAIAVERQAESREANNGLSTRYNLGSAAAKKNRADRKMSGAQQVTTSRDLTALERRRTARLLASVAVDAADLVELLAAAGVTAQDGKAVLEPTTSTTARSGDC